MAASYTRCLMLALAEATLGSFTSTADTRCFSDDGGCIRSGSKRLKQNCRHAPVSHLQQQRTDDTEDTDDASTTPKTSTVTPPFIMTHDGEGAQYAPVNIDHRDHAQCASLITRVPSQHAPVNNEGAQSR